MHLYGDHKWDSPWFFSAFVALREKGVPFELTTFNLSAGEQRREPYRSHSMTGRIPAIEHGGFWLTESAAIAEYVEEMFPSPRYASIFPSSIDERARARQIMGWLRTDLGALREERPTTSMFFARAKVALSRAARRDADKLLRITEALVIGRSHLFGSWSVVDAELAFCLHRLILNGDSVSSDAKAYAELQWKRPSVQEFIEHPRPTIGT